MKINFYKSIHQNFKNKYVIFFKLIFAFIRKNKID